MEPQPISDTDRITWLGLLIVEDEPVRWYDVDEKHMQGMHHATIDDWEVFIPLYMALPDETVYTQLCTIQEAIVKYTKEQDSNRQSGLLPWVLNYNLIFTGITDVLPPTVGSEYSMQLEPFTFELRPL